MINTKKLEDLMANQVVLAEWTEGETLIDAAEVEPIAKELIGLYHQHLANARIAYVFKKKASRKNGRTVLGTMGKTNRKFQHFANYDYIMTIAYTEWTELSAKQKIALVDHELCHAIFDQDNDTYLIQGHTIEEFRQVIDRHGFWMDGIKAFANSIRQVPE